MRILIIGGTRFVGPRVVRRLVAAGHDVTVFYRGLHDADLPPTVQRVRDHRALAPVLHYTNTLRKYAPELVLHMMAVGERDAMALSRGFSGIARRLIVPSSGDVYRAYGIFKKMEEGPVESGLLTENSPLRTRFYPYRSDATPPESLEYNYEKILVERTLADNKGLPATILRLPKVYGPEDNRDLATVYGFRHKPDWRWTHGYAENVADAIVCAMLDDRATGHVFNVGEEVTPTMGERLAFLPPSNVPTITLDGNYAQHIAYDTSLIRRELGYRESVAEQEAMVRTAAEAAARVQPA